LRKRGYTEVMDHLTPVLAQIDSAVAEIELSFQRWARNEIVIDPRMLNEEKLRLLAARLVLTGGAGGAAEPLRRQARDEQDAAGRARIGAALRLGGQRRGPA
jgi:hypothetical protein